MAELGKAMYYLCKNCEKKDLLVLLYTESKGCYFFCVSVLKNVFVIGGSQAVTLPLVIKMLEAKHSFMYFCSFYWLSDIKVPL